MNLDIQTEHVAMQAEWHHMIEDWVTLCRDRYPGVGALDLTLRHATDRPGADEVEAVVTLGGRSLRAHGAAAVMSLALGDALGGLERELGACELIDERARIRHPSSAWRGRRDLLARAASVR
jgi:ribosome-associated translation inhibitor RaiA